MSYDGHYSIICRLYTVTTDHSGPLQFYFVLNHLIVDLFLLDFIRTFKQSLSRDSQAIATEPFTSMF